MTKINKAIIIGGIIGLAIHFVFDHQANLADYLTIGFHNIVGIAFVLAGGFIGLIIKNKKVLR